MGEDYLNLFNPIFSMIFDILKYNKVFQNVHDIKLYLVQNINPELLKMIDLNSFLGIKQTDPYILDLDNSSNIYNKRKRRKERQKQSPFDDNDHDENHKNNALSDMAQNFQNTNTK